MADENETTETQEAPVAEVAETPAAEAAPVESAPEEFKLSKEDWERTQQAIQFMAQHFIPEDEPEYESDDPAERVVRHIDDRVRPLEGMYAEVLAEKGAKKMKEMFSKFEQEYGSFDHSVAEKVGEALYQQTGDAETSVVEAAKFAAEVRKREREEAIKEYQESLKGGGGDDLAVEGSGERSSGKFKTADEVIAHWAAQSEV